MENLELIKRDIDAILQIEFEDLLKMVENTEDLISDNDSQEAIDAFNELYVKAQNMTESEYLEAFKQLQAKWPDFGVGDPNSYKKSIEEAETLSNQFRQLQLATDNGKYLLALKLKSLELDIKIYQLLIDEPISGYSLSIIDTLENENNKIVLEINNYLEKYDY